METKISNNLSITSLDSDNEVEIQVYRDSHQVSGTWLNVEQIIQLSDALNKIKSELIERGLAS